MTDPGPCGAFGSFQSGSEALYVLRVSTRLIVIVFSLLGTAATVVAVAGGRWIYAALLYGLTVLGLVRLLGRAVGRIRTRSNQPKPTIVAGAGPDKGAR
jgi:hypothetical protein